MVERVRAFAAAAAVADLDELALGRTFDRVVCWGVLDFMTDPEACLARLADHVAPGGRLVVMVPRRSFAGMLYRAWQRRANAIAVHLFTAWQLDRVAAARGLALIARVHPFVHSLVLAWERPRG
jgi:trans-aconitate methyltransferase